jgi:hypothetical protein
VRLLAQVAVACALVGCAGLRQDRIYGYYSRYYVRTGSLPTFFAREAIDRRCPLVGLPAEAVRLSFGRPDLIEPLDPDSNGSSQRWVYDLARPGPVISIIVHDDTVAAWSANSRAVWRKVPAPPGHEWPSTKASELNAFVERHPDTPDGIVYAMARGCPQPGMTLEMLQATWGMPPRTDSVGPIGSRRLRLIYVFGLEGQNYQLEFAGDSLVGGRECGFYSSPTDPPECRQ